MGINKVMYGSKTVIDLSGSTVASDKMLEGIIGYNAAGEEVIGTHQCQAGIGTGTYVWAIYDTKEEWNYTSKSLTSTSFPDGYDSTTYVGWTITDDGYFELNRGTTSGATYYLPEDSVDRKAKKILREGRYSVINPYTVMTIKDMPDTVKGDNLLGYISDNSSSAYPEKGIQDNKYYIRISGSDADVTAGKMLSGIVGYTNNGKVTGSIQSQAAQTITPSTTDQKISSGKYLSGTQTIKGDANLLAENIKKDISIFGVTGTYESSDSSGGKNVAQGTITGAGTNAVTIDTGLNSFTTLLVVKDSFVSATTGIGILVVNGIGGTCRGFGVGTGSYIKSPSISVGAVTVNGGTVTYTPSNEAQGLISNNAYTWYAIE